MKEKKETIQELIARTIIRFEQSQLKAIKEEEKRESDKLS